MAYTFCILTDVPKAQGDQKVVIKLLHVCDGLQVSVNQQETVVLPQGSGSLNNSALYHRLCHLLTAIICFFMLSSSCLSGVVL